jgi:hypothetical protein
VAVRAILQATFPSPENGLLGYESTQIPIFDLDHGAPIFERGQEKEKRLTSPKNQTLKIQGDVEALNKGYWGGNIEGALKKVDLEKILS